MKKFDKLVSEAISRIPEDEVIQSDLATIKLNGGMMKIAGQRAEDYKKVTNVYRICDKCGVHVMKSAGRYPNHCSNCGDIIDDKDKEVVVEGTKEEYDEFFKKKLKQWKIESPNELSDEDKKKFFKEVESEYKDEDPKTDDKDE